VCQYAAFAQIVKPMLPVLEHIKDETEDIARRSFDMLSVEGQKVWRAYLEPHIAPRFLGLSTTIDGNLSHYRPWQLVMFTAIVVLITIMILEFISERTRIFQEKGKSPSQTETHTLIAHRASYSSCSIQQPAEMWTVHTPLSVLKSLFLNELKPQDLLILADHM